MAVYEYKALDTNGRKLKGIVDAGSIVAARQRLRESGIFPVEFREATVSRKGDPLSGRSVTSFFNRTGPAEISAMTRQLATLLGAGLPLVPSLNILVAQTSHSQLKKILAQIKEEVNEGNSLSGILSSFPRTFPPFYVNMVRAGEASGMMELVLERLADFFERQQELRRKIKTALAYPMFMFAVGCLIMFFLVTFVVPNITQVFEEMNQTLPLITIALIAASRFFQSFWWILLAVTVSAAVLLNYAAGTPRGKQRWDRFKLGLPLIGALTRKMAVARFSRTLATLLESGVPLLNSLDIVKNIVGNSLIRDAVENAGKEIEEGQSLSSPLARSGLFPPIATEMIAVGEQSGNLENMLYRIADAHEKEVEASVSVVTSIMEPAMILIMGLVVGFIVVSVLLPIFEMNQLVR
ncbi:MAG: type II secretion system inner membrane protein GspF [Syntrophales bacterium]|nr:type II secretion system inner membrane protein GspF [Syntrophales bacterium]MDD5531320.1 type II secretion system inner membrane protein GspF [Syntrophales bacterium]